MHRALLATIALGALAPRAFAEPCHQGDVKARSDRDLQILDGVTCLDGSLDLSNNVANLAPLKSLREINGNLRVVHAEHLSSLRGLDTLVRISGSLRIGGPKQGVPKLRTIDGLKHLVEIGGGLWLGGGYIFKPGASVMSPIDGVTGLTSLARVGGDVHLWDVRGFRGLNALIEIGGNLEVSHSDFRVLAGFAKLERIGGDIHFTNNQILAKLSAAPELATVGGDIIVDCTNKDDPTASLRLTEKVIRRRFEKVAVTGTVWRIATVQPCWVADSAR